MTDNWTKPLPAGWQGGEAVTKWWRGSILHLYRLRKPCAQCAAEMVIDVTAAALEGTAKNAGLLLQRCQACRAASKGGTSRPRTDKPAETQAMAFVQAASPDEVTALRAERDEYAQSVMDRTQENGKLRRDYQALFEQLQVIKARLATYELQPALEALGCEAVQNTSNSGTQDKLTFPWHDA